MYSLREQILLLSATPFYIIIIVTEILITKVKWGRSGYTRKDNIENLGLNFANAFVDAGFKVVYLWVLLLIYSHSPFQEDWGSLLLYWLLLLLAQDFMFYWQHRLEHEIRLLWAVHITHHSSQQFNFGVGFRSSVFSPLYRFVFFIPLTYAGFRPLDILFMYSATQIWGTLVHTELVGKLGWLEYIFVTPSHHRVHHSSNPRYLDKNMGMFLIIWDKLFGTFQEELPEETYAPIRYGLTTNPEKRDFASLIFSEWKQIWRDVRQKELSPAQKMKYIFGPPGFSHDGSRKTSRQMLEEENRRLMQCEQTDKEAMDTGINTDKTPEAVTFNEQASQATSG